MNNKNRMKECDSTNCDSKNTLMSLYIMSQTKTIHLRQNCFQPTPFPIFVVTYPKRAANLVDSSVLFIDRFNNG